MNRYRCTNKIVNGLFMEQDHYLDYYHQYILDKQAVVGIQFKIYKIMKDQYISPLFKQTSDKRFVENPSILHNFARSHRNQLNNTESDLIPQNRISPTRKLSPITTLQEDYQPARYAKALQYRKMRSYFIKQPDGRYKEITLFESTDSLKYFGLGPYFYIEFMRKIAWIFFIFSIIEVIRIYLHSKGKGLQNYSASFSTYLINTTIGNYDRKSLFDFDNFIVALGPFLILLISIIFYIYWKCHFYNEIGKQDENNLNVKPQKFCVEVECIDELVPVTQNNLHSVFKNFGHIHEISLVKDYENKLIYFQQLQQMEEQIKLIQLQLKLGYGDVKALQQLRNKKQDLLQEMQSFNINPKTISAYVHFQYEKSKADCLNYYHDHYLYDTCLHGCIRNTCCCFIPKTTGQFRINSQYDLKVKDPEVPAPQDLNWQSFQISLCSKFCRYLLALLIILVFLALSCTIIGICTIYVSSRSSDCSGVNVPQTLAEAQASTVAIQKTCYCNSNLLTALTDSAIQTYCSTQLQKIYIEQAIQYAIIFTSVITNFLFGLVVDRIVNFTRPSSQSQSLKVKTLVYTIFLIFNTVFLPILLYSDIFGFKSTSYFSFVTMISSGFSNFLQVEKLQLYLDYDSIWYRNVSPVFTNYLIFDVFSVWIMYFVTKCRTNFSNLQNDERKILQKHMNKDITSYSISVYKEYSNFILIIFLALFLYYGIPILIPLAWLNILSRYITNRSLLQSNSRRIDGLGVVFNQLPHHILPLLLVLGALNGCWMITSKMDVLEDLSIFQLKLWSGSQSGVLGRQLQLPFYILSALAVVLEYLVYHILVRLISWLCTCCFEKKKTINPRNTKTFSEHKKTMNILTSYNIKNNDRMRSAVLMIEKYIKRQIK